MPVAAVVDSSPDLAISKPSSVDVDMRRLFTACPSLAVGMPRDSRLTDGIIFSSSPRLLAPAAALDVSSWPRLDRMSSFSSPADTELVVVLHDVLECLDALPSAGLSLQ